MAKPAAAQEAVVAAAGVLPGQSTPSGAPRAPYMRRRRQGRVGADRVAGVGLDLLQGLVDGGVEELPGPRTAVLARYAPCAPIQKHHRKPIYIGKCLGCLKAPEGPDLEADARAVLLIHRRHLG